MKRFALQIAGLLLLALLIPGLVFAAEVAQGKCTAYDKDKKTITIEEYDINFSKEHKYGNPTGIVSTFEAAEAKMGIPPEAGDILRIAYTVSGETKTAVKVMNVSKQDLMKK
mgnify:CR=1 FL=1